MLFTCSASLFNRPLTPLPSQRCLGFRVSVHWAATYCQTARTQNAHLPSPFLNQLWASSPCRRETARSDGQRTVGAAQKVLMKFAGHPSFVYRYKARCRSAGSGTTFGAYNDPTLGSDPWLLLMYAIARQSVCVWEEYWGPQASISKRLSDHVSKDTAWRAMVSLRHHRHGTPRAYVYTDLGTVARSNLCA